MSNFNSVSGRGYCASNYYSYPSNSCTLSGTNVVSPSTVSAGGGIVIVGTKSVRFSCFGGAGSGNTFSATLNIPGIGSYFLSCTQYQTKNTDISLGAGSYSFSITRGSYSGSSGNNASLACL
jgi:hypothetical protein